MNKMINIDDVHKPDRGFPTIDFKFQNTGSATAFLWQFGITIIQAEVDVTPVFDFEANTQNNELCIKLTNNGWGKLDKVSITLNQPTINQLFNQSSRQFNGSIKSGETQTVFRLSKEMAIPSEYNSISKSFTNIDDEYSRHRSEQPTQGIIINGINVSWNCTDQNGKNHQGQNNIRLSWAAIALTAEGFTTIHYPPPSACVMPSDITYITMIDSTAGSHERLYPISRKIPPGDVERFHIMVGSKMSCHLKVKFRFFIDKKDVVESDEFNIHIWNPRNSWWGSDYEDGSELKNKKQRDDPPEYYQYRTRNLSEQMASYPFSPVSPKVDLENTDESDFFESYKSKPDKKWWKFWK